MTRCLAGVISAWVRDQVTVEIERGSLATAVALRGFRARSDVLIQTYINRHESVNMYHVIVDCEYF